MQLDTSSSTIPCTFAHHECAARARMQASQAVAAQEGDYAQAERRPSNVLMPMLAGSWRPGLF
eukprot:13117635-Alexandrium_andersonii.AAC.1